MPAIPVHHTATSNATWDAGKARRGYPNKESVLKYVSGWYDSNGDPNAKSTYKFPHHYTDGGPAVLAGVRNGLARLPNAQVDDKAAIEAHLRAHLEDGGGADDHDHTRLITLSPDKPWKNVYQDWRNRLNDRTEQHPIVNPIWNAESPNEMMIYDEIGYWGVTAARFNSQLRDMSGDITVRFNSPGGDVFDAFAIYNAIKAYDGHVTGQIDGLAASAASFIAMACDFIVANETSSWMIHDAIGMTMGNAADMQKMASLLDKSSQQIAEIYAKRAGNTADYWRNLMKDEKWFNGNESVDYGLADETVELALIEGTPTNQLPVKNEPPGRPLITVKADTASVFKFALADATRPVDQPATPPPFTLDPDVFRAAMIECTNSAPANKEPRPNEKKPAIPVSKVSLSELADALREGLR